jgi:hypothetical protein
MTWRDSALLSPVNSALRRVAYSSAGLEGFPAIVCILEEQESERKNVRRPKELR